MPTEQDLHKFKFTKKEDPKNLSLASAKITMRYKVKLPNSKKAAHILRLGKLHYADVLAAKERSCRLNDQRLCTIKELLECMPDTWKLCGGTPDEGNSKLAAELALVNLMNQGNKGKGFQGNCHKCGKKGHKCW